MFQFAADSYTYLTQNARLNLNNRNCYVHV